MPDITMCCNHECPLREKCYRYRARPDKYWQSYAFYKPENKPFGPVGDTSLECEYFWKLDVVKDDFLPLDWIDTTFDRDTEKWGGLK